MLGYSAGGPGDELHPICVARLRHAEEIAEGARAVVLSGYARHGGRGEAELMRAAWAGPDVPLVCDTTARSTAGNAAGIAAAARALAADQVVVVTSGWHRLRARALVRSALRGSGIAVEASSAPGVRRPGSPFASWPALPPCRWCSSWSGSRRGGTSAAPTI